MNIFEYNARLAVVEQMANEAAAIAKNEEATFDERVEAIVKQATALEETTNLMLAYMRGEVSAA